MSDDEIPAWLDQLRQDQAHGADEIWERYFDKLVRLAHHRLGGLPRRAFDEEDVALSAMNSFVQGARAGRFPQLDDESDLWRLLITITARKASAQRRRHFAVRRDRGKVRGESVFQNPGDLDEGAGIGGVLGKEPTPQFAAQVAEEYRALFDKLDDPLLRDIARWKLEGFNNDEIAEKVGRTPRTIERKLNLIRKSWSGLA